MEILNFDVDLPQGTSVRRTGSTASWSLAISGVGEEPLHTTIVNSAQTAGFVERRRSAERTELERGEQRIVLVRHENGLSVMVFDPTVLPAARHDGSTVMIGDLRIDTRATSVVPLRERRTDDGRMRSGAWRLADVTAVDVVEQVIAQAISAKDLKRGASFGPPKGGREVWSGEAYSKLELIKARAMLEPDWVLLEIDFVGNHD